MDECKFVSGGSACELQLASAGVRSCTSRDQTPAHKSESQKIRNYTCNSMNCASDTRFKNCNLFRRMYEYCNAEKYSSKRNF